MRYTIPAIALIIAAQPCIYASERGFEVKIESRWQDLENSPQKVELFDGKWILVGVITFKKTMKQTAKLRKIDLEWHGSPIAHLTGSLFKQEGDKKFLPIDDFHICESNWHKAKQCLTFTFKEKEKLGLENTYYIVLTIPNALEDAIKHGSFTIKKQCLPTQLRHCTVRKNLTISFNNTAAYPDNYA